MTAEHEHTIKVLKELQGPTDTEVAHGLADDYLCIFLEYLGYTDVVEEWKKVDKWYA